ncbi:MAG: 30S ribosomal protein S6 [Bacteroidetes bacterium]|jgi:small subunit ribosomal protein S6|nr:30S ribosomal protein S6 [Bacteroidota bacterium]
MAEQHTTYTYELTYIINTVLNEKQIQDAVRRVNNVIQEHGGEVVEVDEWGSQRLAYAIKKRRNGHYVNLYFEGEEETVQRLERALQIDDDILRYLTLRVTPVMERQRHEDRKAYARAQAEAAKEQAAREAEMEADEDDSEDDA